VGFAVDDNLLQQQIDYYRARSGEYDEWFYRQKRYDRGAALSRQWFDEVRAVRRDLFALGRVESALELACGTGIWTQELCRIAAQITALDASEEMIAINHAKVAAEHASYQQADLFAWQPDRQYDLVFFAFWLSHVPADRLDGFLNAVSAAVKPGGHLFLIDSRHEPTSTAADSPLRDDEHIIRTRKLNDGREFKVVKVFYEPADLHAHLSRAGFAADVQTTDHYFIYAKGVKE
jgi:demethylmenaquinone methyltransferase/2-methoxy-6-polyprenyl-1,4-benzoquinol methylase